MRLDPEAAGRIRVIFPLPHRRSTHGTPDPLIKICGICHPADAQLALELGADALGLNFYAKSSRCLSPAQDGGWVRALPSVATRIAVVVNATRDEIDRLLGEGLADAVQLHGDEDEAFCRSLAESGVPFIKALRLRDQSVLDAPERFHTPYLLLDAYQPGSYGGTGQPADWSLAARFVALERPGSQTWLSGGLHAENVAAAVRQVRPGGVDVASGVEGAGGARRKDAARLRRFFAAVRG